MAFDDHNDNRWGGALSAALSVSETLARVNAGDADTQAGAVPAGRLIVGTSMRDPLQRCDEIPSASPAPAWNDEEQRRAPRFTLLIRSAKLTTPTSEFLCVVRDASEAGISVRLFHPLPANEPLTLELPNGDRVPLERVWEDEGRAGFQFKEPVELERIVESKGAFAKRAVRVNLEVPCTLLAGVRRTSATILNLSQQGAQIRTAEPLSLLERVRLVADGMPQVAAKVRWRKDQRYGLGFEDTFQFAELAELAFELRRQG